MAAVKEISLHNVSETDNFGVLCVTALPQTVDSVQRNVCVTLTVNTQCDSLCSVLQEVLYHAVAFIMYLVAGIILLVEIKHYEGAQYYKAFLAAAVSIGHDLLTCGCAADIVCSIHRVWQTSCGAHIVCGRHCVRQTLCAADIVRRRHCV
jgi:hypothetical protein